MNRQSRVDGWLYEASAAGCPDDVVPTGVTVAEEQNPLVIVDVGCAAPARVVAEDLHIPLAWEGVFNFLLDEEGVGVYVCAVDLGRLVDDVCGQGLLTVCDAGSMSLEDGMGFLAVSGALGEPGLLLDEHFHGFLHVECGCGEGDCQK